MIFVTVGTTPFPFVRMRDIVLRLVTDIAPGETIIFQHGATAPVQKDFVRNVYALPFARVQRYMSSARVVVCHGGPATIYQALYAGKIPFVLPRNSVMGEHVDNHQVYFSAFMQKGGKIRSADRLREARSKIASSVFVGSPRRNNRYIAYLTGIMQ